MNAKLKTHFFGIVAVSAAVILSIGCSSPSTGGDPTERVVIDSKLGSFVEKENNTAANVVYNMGFGWNLGNTFDASNGYAVSGYTKNSFENAGTSSERSWGQPTTTQAMIKAIKKAGIRTIRIPISWHNHITNSNYDIDAAWMSRVKQVVDWAIAENLYVIINVHHDNVGPGTTSTFGNGYCPTEEDKTNSKNYLEKIWKQICETFKDYDNHLVFESINEPRVIGEEHEWNWKDSCPVCKTAMKLTVEYNQLIVDTIRASGENNAKRLIMVPSYVAAPGSALNSAFSMPTDSANMLALSVHMYSPYNFAMGYPGDKEFTSSHKSELTGTFDSLKNSFISKGIPVVIGEMGATNKNNLSAREAWFSFFVSEARKRGMCPVLWDNGSNTIEKANGNGSEVYGFFNRTSGTWYFPTLIENAVNATYQHAQTKPVDPPSGSGDSGSWKSIWTGTQDLKHWDGADGITLNASSFSTATASTKIRFTISIGADCTAADCSNNYSTIHPITDWTDGNINFPESNTEHQLAVSPTSSASTVTITPDSASWAAIKSKGLILYGHKVVITKIELL